MELGAASASLSLASRALEAEPTDRCGHLHKHQRQRVRVARETELLEGIPADCKG